MVGVDEGAAGGAGGALTDPLILTLALDAASQARFEALRRAHFPPALNRIPAHVTMFHHLPGEAEAAIAHELRAACAGVAPFAVRATGLRFMGRGVAYELAASELTALRRRLADRFSGWLNAQDRQGWKPHVTVQNKASSAEAKALYATMTAAFTPFSVSAEGLRLWWYRGGPWEPAGEFGFGALAGSGGQTFGGKPVWNA